MKIAIAGYGAEGQSNYRYFSERGHDVTIADEREVIADIPEGATALLGANAFSELRGFDLVVRTAGLAPQKINTDGKIWSATSEFFATCTARIIGVTGSKGKGTTSSLIATMLRAAGQTVHLVGNIGVPALDVVATIKADDIVVYELSSFQLWDLEISPNIAIVLHIEPDHLDVHADFADYISAKSHIVNYQQTNDLAIYSADNEWSKQIARGGLGEKLSYPSVDAVHIADGYFWYKEQKVCSVDALQLPGAHNQANACAAITAAWRLTQDTAVIEQGLRSFYGLDHRLKYIATVRGIAYYDDSIATTPGSAIAAIKSFEQPKVLIVGGSNKGSDYGELVDTIIASDSMRAVLAIGQQGPVIAQLLKDRGAGQVVSVIASKDMTEIVAAASACAQPGDVVVLSPACASFDMFKSYSDRGDQFIAVVNALGSDATIE